MFIQSIINATTAGQAVAVRPARVSGAQPLLPSPGASAPDETAVHKAAEAANEVLRAASSTVQFRVEQNSGKAIVLVVDDETREVIRQIPSEQMIAISREIDRLQGILMRGKA